MAVVIGLGVILIIVVIMGLISRAISHAVDKGANAIEKKVRARKYAEEGHYLGMVRNYRTAAPIYVIQQRLDQNTNIKDLKKVSQDSNQVSYKCQNRLMSGTLCFDAHVVFAQENGMILGKFYFSHASKAGVISPFVRQMGELSQAVDEAFRSADPNVQTWEQQQKMTSSKG